MADKRRCVTASLILLVALCSCSSNRIVTTNVSTTDVEVIERIDTICVSQPDSASLIAYLKCDSLNNVIMTQVESLQGCNISLAYQLAHRDNMTQLIVNCDTDSLLAVIASKDSIIHTRQIITRTVEVERQLTALDYICRIGFVLSMLFILLIIFFVIKCR